MIRAIRNLPSAAARVLLALRYRVRVVGLDQLPGLRGALVLPNHPAYVDPALVLAHLAPVLAPRPMLLRSMFDNPLLRWLPRALRAVPIPDLERHSAAARAQTEAAIDAVADGLARGENFVLWPAGRARRGGREVIGSNRSAAAILARVPDAPLVLVRTRGLGGSMFGYQHTGAAPPLVRRLLQGAGILVANLLVFAPRRRVEIVVERIDRATLPGVAREQLNPFLEAWYDAPGPEQPTFVPYHFALGRRDFTFPEPADAPRTDPEVLDPAARAAAADLVAEVVAERLGAPTPALDDPATSLDALGLDSLDRMELSLELEERTGFRGAGVPDTVGDLWALAAGRAGDAGPGTAPPAWHREPARTGALRIDGATVVEAFAHRAVAHGREIAAADDLSGVVTYERFAIAAEAFAARLARVVPGPHVGVLLPASVAADLAIFAVLFAGKVPVMVNWTTGPAHVAHGARLTGLTHVVTSRRFVDRMAIAVEGAELLFVEDLRAGIGRLELLARLARARLRPRGLLRRLPAAAPDATAVVLFTSGSEKAPKAVPLTHANLLANLRGVLDAYPVFRSDVFLAFLPPFHSFGFTLTVLMPLLGGCRVVHHPDPTDGVGLARKLHAWSATLLGATPTFLSNILARAAPGQLASLRIAVVGGEACPPRLFDELARIAPDAELLEGYGVSECAPLVAAMRPGGASPRGSIGVPLPGVDVLVVDPDTRAPVPPGELGELLVAGANVFPGYLGHAGEPPFDERDGRRWYRTGDLVVRDADGTLRFRGRSKRFLKAGGEMISLPALEAPLAARYPPTDDGPRVAVEGVDVPARRIVLFTVEPVSRQDANAILAAAGLRGVMRIDAVRTVDAIPVLGTGKVDYKVLRAMLADAAG